MRKAAPVVLMIWPYLFGLVLLMPNESETAVNVFLGVYLILTVAVYVLNIWNAVTWSGERAADRLALYDMVIKLVHIPFYIGVFLVGVLFFLALTVHMLLFVSALIVLLLAIIDFFLMITSSMYGISAALRQARAGERSKKSAALHGVLHLIFVADVVSAICLFRQSRRHPAQPGAD